MSVLPLLTNGAFEDEPPAHRLLSASVPSSGGLLLDTYDVARPMSSAASTYSPTSLLTNTREDPGERAMELRKRVEVREAGRRADRLLHVAERRAHEAREKERKRRAAKDARDAAKARWKLSMIEQDHVQALIVRHSEQTWDAHKRLGIMKRSVRTSVEGIMHQGLRLEALEDTLLHMRQAVHSESGLVPTVRDELIDQELARTTHVANACPKCGGRFLKRFIEQHVKSCKGGKAAKTSSPQTDNSAAAVLAASLSQSAKRAMAVLVICEVCGKQVLESRLEKHLATCKKRAQYRNQKRERRQLRLRKQKDAHLQLGVMPPQPPQNVRLGEVGTSYVTLLWKAPIFTGGDEVCDYEIFMSITEKRFEGKRVHKTVQALPPVTTSRWYLRQPVASTGFRVHGLLGDTAYVNITVRARNKAGLSEPSNAIELVTTKPVARPTPPLVLVAAMPQVSSDSIQLRWAKPWSDGGARIAYYEILYTHLANKEVVGGAKLDSGGTEERRTTVRTRDARSQWKLVDLDGNRVYSNIVVVAVSEAGLRSEPSEPVAAVRTCPSDKAQELRDEIARLAASRSQFIDSTLNNGFAQRFDRIVYLAKLRKELEAFEAAKREEAAEAAALRREDDDETATAAAEEMNTGGAAAAPAAAAAARAAAAAPPTSSLNIVSQISNRAPRQGRKTRRQMQQDRQNVYMLEVARRRRHFTFRIQALEARIAEAAVHRKQCMEECSELLAEMHMKEKRTREVLAELDRVCAFSGKHVDSAIMHGRPQRFLTASLRKALEEEIVLNNNMIAAGKKRVIELQNFQVADVERGANPTEQLQDRRAAQAALENEVKRKTRASSIVQRWGGGGGGEVSLAVMFRRFVDGVEMWKEDRALMTRILKRLENRSMAAGFEAWVRFYRDALEADAHGRELRGLGSTLLAKVEHARFDMAGEAAEALNAIVGAQKELAESRRTKEQRNVRAASAVYEAEAAHKATRAGVEMAHYNCGNAHAENGRMESAIMCFERHAEAMRILPDVEEQGQAYFRMGECYHALEQCDKAIIHFSRATSLAREVQSKSLEAMCIMGTGQAYNALTLHRSAADSFERALELFGVLGDKIKEAEALRGLQREWATMHDSDRSTHYRERAEAIENSAVTRFADTYERFNHIQQMVVGVTSGQSTKVELELVAGRVPSLRATLSHLDEELEEHVKEQHALAAAHQKLEARLTLLQTDMAQAKQLKGTDEMNSGLIHGANQRFQVKELRNKLKLEFDKAETELAEVKKAQNRVRIRLSNTLDNAQERQAELDSETGDLMKKVLGRQTLRCAALNPSNLSGNDVLGNATGGFNQLICSVKDKISVFDLDDGELMHVIAGDEPGRHVGPLVGHHGTITSLHYREDRMYSGGVDHEVRVWDGTSFECLMVYKGHEGSVWAIESDPEKVVTGAADNTCRIWDCNKPVCLVVVRGHYRTVRCLSLGKVDNFVTGSADYELRLWQLTRTAKGRLQKCATNVRRLVGHGCAISCCVMKGTEAISGGVDGNIIIWDLVAGRALRKCAGHEGPVTCLIFDAMNIFSGGVDHTVRVFEIATGDCITTMRGHEGAVLAIQADSTKILTASGDGSMRQWHFGGKATNRSLVKHHLLRPGESLPSLAAKYGVDIKVLAQWNRIKDPKKMYIGMRLVVSKGTDLQKVRRANLRQKRLDFVAAAQKELEAEDDSSDSDTTFD